MSEAPLVIGTEPARPIGELMGGTWCPVPDVTFDSRWSGHRSLESWRTSTAAGVAATEVVVAVWPDVPRMRPVLDLAFDDWLAGFEVPSARWCAALGAGISRCRDGGRLVAVVDRPAPLDCAGWGMESALSDAVEALCRSLARAHGPRGVRVNVVTTPVRLTRPPVVAPPPPLGRFPGTVEEDVVGAVRLLLSDHASGVTGTVVHADSGRSWR